MKLGRIAISVSTVAVALLIVAAPASAADTPWTHNSFGANPGFGWTDGEWLDGHPDSAGFGSPWVTPLGFFFDNDYGDMSMEANSSYTLVDGSVQANVDVGASSPVGGLPINQIIFREGGNWAITNGGNFDDEIMVVAQYYVLEHETNDFSQIFTWDTFTNPGSFVFNPDGTWEAEFTLTYTEAATGSLNGTFPNVPFTSFDFQFTNQLFVSGNEGTFINKTYAHVIFPEPGTLLLLGVAALAVVRRRTR